MSRLRRWLTIALPTVSLFLGACGAGNGAGDPSDSGGDAPSANVANNGGGAAGDQVYTDNAVYSSDANASLVSNPEAAAVTHHQMTLNGAQINFTATAGHLTAANPSSKAPEASIFYVAYTKEGADLTQRPVTFIYSGGPGSASMWLHLGSFGPKRLDTGNPSANPPTPFPLVDNQETLLDTTDLVFVDAVGTGYSEAIAPNTNQSFWGVDADAEVFRDFVLRYLAVNNRSQSPIFLYGEAYGATRTPVLTNALQAVNVNVAGIALQSPILDYASNCGTQDFAMANCAGFIPTYAAVGAYYGLDQPNPTDLTSYLQTVRDYTNTYYAPTVDQIINSSNAPDLTPYSAMITQLTNYTGASAQMWSDTYLDLDPVTYQLGLINNQMIGLYDARVSVSVDSDLAVDGDPSITVMAQPFTEAWQDYLPNYLRYYNDSTYTVEGDAINSWDFGHNGTSLVDAVPDLATAMAANPDMAVIALNGYYDLVTPFYQTELDLSRLGTTQNLQVTHYASGHMIYLDANARPAAKADLVQFYNRALMTRK